MLSFFKLRFSSSNVCGWGGARDKWSSWYTNAKWLKFLQKACDGTHKHKPWGVSWKGKSYSWNTAEEAEYPAKLCAEVAHAAQQAAMDMGAFEVSKQGCKRKATHQLQSAAAGRQPRGNRFPEVIPEFKYTFDTEWTSSSTKCPRLLCSEGLAEKQVPNGKLLSVVNGGKSGESIAKIGVYRTCEEFVEQAAKLQHPFDNSSMVLDEIKINIFELLTKGSQWVENKRHAALQYYAERKRSLAADESAIHQSMDPSREEIVSDKAFLLFNEMCRDAGIQDEGLLDLQVLGTPLAGVSGTSSLFEEVSAQPSLAVDQLMKSSRWSRKMLFGRNLQQSTSKAVEEEIWKLKKAGWLGQ